jgi:hypothetical protein
MVARDKFAARYHHRMSESLQARIDAHNAGSPTNPYRATLVTIAILGIVIGTIVTVVGANNYNSYSPGLFSFHHDSGIGELAVGGSLGNLGVLALMVLFGAELVLWAGRRTAALASEVEATRSKLNRGPDGELLDSTD